METESSLPVVPLACLPYFSLQPFTSLYLCVCVGGGGGWIKRKMK